MKDIKVEKQKESHTDKGMAKRGLDSPKKELKPESLLNISPDTFLSEKDEVKNAEEKLRQKNKED